MSEKKSSSQRIRLKAELTQQRKERPALTRLEQVYRHFAGQPDPKKVAVVLQQFGVMMANGVAMVDILESLASQQENEVLKESLEVILQKVIFEGHKLSVGFSLFPRIYPSYCVLLIRAGETSGDLSSRLIRAAQLLDRNCGLVSKAKSAVTSPLFTLGFSGLVVFGILQTIMPRFVDMYQQLDLELPLITRMVIWVVKIINDPFMWLALAAGVVGLYINREMLRERIYDLALHTSPFNKWLGIFLCTELCDILSSLVTEGIPVHTSMSMMAETTPRLAHKRYLKKAAHDLSTNGDLIEAMSLIPYFPPMFCSMCAVGVEAGSLDQMLNQVHKILEQQTEAVLDSVINLLEPVTVCMTGFVLSFLFLGLFLPIYGVLSKLGL